MTAAELLEQALKLPREEQMKLAHDLWVEADRPYEDPTEVEAAWGRGSRATPSGHRRRDHRRVPDSEVRRRALACDAEEPQRMESSGSWPSRMESGSPTWIGRLSKLP
ncbi:MAG: hypothetical protein R2717_04900 [Schumannella sp.]